MATRRYIFSISLLGFLMARFGVRLGFEMAQDPDLRGFAESACVRQFQGAKVGFVYSCFAAGF